MNYRETLKKVADHSIELFLNNIDERLYYHNLDHASRVLDAIKKINTHYNLDDKNFFIVSTAAWLYELEVIAEGSGSGEIKSIQRSEEILQSLGIGNDEKEAIKNCMLATGRPQQPSSILEKIFCDAQIFYTGSPAFTEYNRLMRKETEALSNIKFKNSEWRAKTISFLENHHFLTDYCQSLLNKAREENLQAIIKTQEEHHAKRQLKTRIPIESNKEHQGNKNLSSVYSHNTESLFPKSAHYAEDQENQGGLASKKVEHHLRGVETMFSNTSSNHMRLSVMADNKAFIMISVNSILISIAIGLIIGKFFLIPKLFIPTILLLSVNVVTIIYAVLATRPGVMKGTFTRKDVEDKTVDLLFFGSFYKMPLEEFRYGMKEMMDDYEFLYGTFIKDIYLQGKTLGRKFRLLRISYNIFMYGMAATVFAFIIFFLFVVSP